jgi:putative transposase
MPRPPRFCPAGFPVHVIQRGNNRQTLFTADTDLAAYTHWLARGAAKFNVQVNGWVFMTNHVHLLLTPQHEDAVSRLIQYVGCLYVRYFNFTYARSGTLFEGRFKSSLVQEEDYFLNCLRYIELNPVRAGMVTDPGDYRWSSYHAHAFGVRASIWTPHEVYLSLGDDPLTRQKSYRNVMKDVLDMRVVAKIRHCANSGLILGSEKFRNQVAALVE